MSEMSRVYDLGLPWALKQNQKIVATPEECQAITRRFNILRVNEVTAEITISPEYEDQCFKVTGELCAKVSQACVLSFEPVEEIIQTPVNIKIRLSPQEEDREDHLSEDIEYALETKVDIGELLLQYLSLSLNPYPRKEGASIKSSGFHKTQEENPFAILSSLKRTEDITQYRKE